MTTTTPRKALCLLFCLFLMVAAIGCTQGQMSPAGVKDCLYSARAEATQTAVSVQKAVDSIPITATPEQRIAVLEESLSVSLASLRRIGGTPTYTTKEGIAAPFEDGLLTPIWHYFKGTVPRNK